MLSNKRFRKIIQQLRREQAKGNTEIACRYKNEYFTPGIFSKKIHSISKGAFHYAAMTDVMLVIIGDGELRRKGIIY